MLQNDNQVFNTRPYAGTPIHSRHSFAPGLPYNSNTNGIEITVVKVSTLPNVTITAIYRSPKISLTLLCRSLIQVLDNISSQYNIIIGDFNVNWMNEMERRPLYNLLVTERNYKQLISHYTTDNRTIIDHIYTNFLLDSHAGTTSGTLETYFTDHKASWLAFPYNIS